VKTLLVVGASGLLGQYVVEAARGRYDTIATYHGHPLSLRGVVSRPLDITDPKAVHAAIQEARPWGVIVTAALTSVDDCEDHPEEAEATNALGPGYLAEATRNARARLLHVSTDYVFDGQRGWYIEEDVPSPLVVYGQTKLRGEESVLARHPGACVVRASAVYGWNRLTPKANFAVWIVEELKAGRIVDLWADQFNTPTYGGHAAPVLLRLLEAGARGYTTWTPPIASAGGTLVESSARSSASRWRGSGPPPWPTPN
jgi:dTDP-4-dehydrorhamnose reductase